MKFSATVTLQYDTIFSSFSHSDYLKGLDWMKESGLDGAELCISNYNDIDVYKIKDELDRRGLGCSTLSTGQARGMEGIALTGAGEAASEAAQKRFMQHIDAASVLKSKVTVGLLRGLGAEATREKDLEQLREAMLPLVDYAEKKGVVLCLEAINRYETAMLNSAEAAMDFVVNRLGNPDSVGILWDLFHANIEDIGFERSVDAMGPKLKHLHLADSNRWFPGYGHTDFKRILKYVKDTGYQEYCSFECLNLPSLDTVLEKTGPWVQSIREL